MEMAMVSNFLVGTVIVEIIPCAIALIKVDQIKNYHYFCIDLNQNAHKHFLKIY
jgi:hypothetical protein